MEDFIAVSEEFKVMRSCYFFSGSKCYQGAKFNFQCIPFYMHDCYWNWLCYWGSLLMSFISWRNDGSLPMRVCITLLLFLGPHISMIFPFLATSLDFTSLCYELHPRPSSLYFSSLLTLSFYTRHLTLDVSLPPFPPLHGTSTAISHLYLLPLLVHYTHLLF